MSTTFDEESGYWPPDHNNGEMETLAFCVAVLLTWFAGASDGVMCFVLSVVAIAVWYFAISYSAQNSDPK